MLSLTFFPLSPSNAEKKSKHLLYRNDDNRLNLNQSQPQAHNFTFESSTVTYGGANGPYYTSSRTRRTSDGVSDFFG